MSDDAPDPSEVFALLSNSTRVDVLRALAAAYSEAPTDPWLDYSELRDAVGVRDNGNFNYHLDQLDGLVVKRPAGYRLSRVGMEVVSTVSSGVFDTEWTWGPVDVPGICHVCDESLHLRYEDGILHLTCGRPEHALALSVAPSLLDSAPEDEVVERIAFLENRWGALTRQGICSECQGRVDGGVVAVDGGVVAVDGDSVHYEYHGTCQCCGFEHRLPVGLTLVEHPAVIAFYDDHGVDVRTTPFWTLDFCSAGQETVVSTGPLRLRVDVEHGGETLSLTLDEQGSVRATDRTRTAGGRKASGGV